MRYVVRSRTIPTIARWVVGCKPLITRGLGHRLPNGKSQASASLAFAVMPWAASTSASGNSG